MIKWDGHTHSEFCRHGSGEKTEEMVEKAIELGFQRYSITEHAPLPDGIIDDPELAADFTLLPDELKTYFDHVFELKSRYAGKIEILSGLEVDYIVGYEEYFDSFISRCQPHLDDLVISVHMIAGKNAVAPIDYSSKTFHSELIEHYGSVEEVHRVYWRDVEAMVLHPIESSLRKRIGHLGLINKYIKKFPVHYDVAEYDRMFERLFAAIKSAHWDLDYNVAGLRKDLCLETYLSDAMLDRCRQNGIHLIYGSDAHSVDGVGQFYDVYESRTLQNM